MGIGYRNGAALFVLSVTATIGVLGPKIVSGQAAQPAVRARNLSVLPKDTPLATVYKTMALMQRDLGVQCSFCHAEDPDTKQIDYVSDENPRKETARFMLQMTADINEKYLGKLGDRQYAPPITCGSCHLGQMHPPPFEPTAK